MNHLPVMDQLDGDGDRSLTYDGDEAAKRGLAGLVIPLWH